MPKKSVSGLAGKYTQLHKKDLGLIRLFFYLSLLFLVGATVIVVLDFFDFFNTTYTPHALSMGREKNRCIKYAIADTRTCLLFDGVQSICTISAQLFLQLRDIFLPVGRSDLFAASRKAGSGGDIFSGYNLGDYFPSLPDLR
jgi:hypothetical protein